MHKESSVVSSREREYMSRLRLMLNKGGLYLSGSLVRRSHTCGKKSCRCMKDKEYRHSSWYIGRSIKGKTHMKYVPHEQIKEVKGWIKQYQVVRGLLRKLGDAGWQRIGKRGR